MEIKEDIRLLLSKEQNVFLQGVSIDNVIFGFYDSKVKILLNKFSGNKKWMLPGGFVFKEETLDEAAVRVLHERTKLKEIYLTQFHTFSDINRIDINDNINFLNYYNIPFQKDHWYLQRLISVGYFSFVRYSEVELKSTAEDQCQWFDIDEIPSLYADHNIIITKSIDYIRRQIGNIPIGYKLLPEKFTMTDLRHIYENLLNEKLDRRNFQRKMLSTGFLMQLNETTKKKGTKSTILFSFDKSKFPQEINQYSYFPNFNNIS